MRTKNIFTFTAALCVMISVAIYCTDFEFDHPLDPKYRGDNPADIGVDNIEQGFCRHASLADGCQPTTKGICDLIGGDFDASLRCDGPSCQRNVNCPDDQGFCNNDCTLVARETCSPSSFSMTRPASCDTPTDPIGNCLVDREVFYDCIQTTQANCITTTGLGTWYGESSCPTMQQPTGMCFFDDNCHNDFTYHECQNRSGIFSVGGPCPISCTPWQGNGCPVDQGYCGQSCELSLRSECSGSFYQTQPSSCNSNSVIWGDDIYYSGQTYRTVWIGNQRWMAENLYYRMLLDDGMRGYWCYNDEPPNCSIYGALYDWATAMNLPSNCNTQSCASQIQPRHQGICPDGWWLPSDDDWTTLVNFVGGSLTAGTKLKSSTGWVPWSGVPLGTDDFGFSALPGGRRRDGSFINVGFWGYWWSATEYDADYARNRGMYYNYEYVHSNWISKSNGLSVRCVRD